MNWDEQDRAITAAAKQLLNALRIPPTEVRVISLRAPATGHNRLEVELLDGETVETVWAWLE